MHNENMKDIEPTFLSGKRKVMLERFHKKYNKLELNLEN